MSNGQPTVWPNLVHDTMFGRARRMAARSVHAIDDAIWRVGRSRVRVLFEAASPVSLAVFRPVLEYLERDPRIEFWFTTSDGTWDADGIFVQNFNHNAGGATTRDRVIRSSQARWMKFDGYINTDFWNMTWLPRRARRVHMFHGVAGKYGLDAPVRIAPVVASFDRLLFPNRDRLLRYAAAGLVDRDEPRAALIGYPKVDCLVDGSLNRTAIQDELGLDRTRPTVLYAPTWSPHSSLNGMGDAIVDALSRLDVNVLVKLHDRSYDGSERGSGGIDWRARMAAWQRKPSVHLATGPDVSPSLFVADALVTDHSSVGFEFMLLDRPLVVIDCPELIRRARISADKVALLRSAAEVVARADAVGPAVRRALSRPHERSERRTAVAHDLFYRPGGATARAADCIYELLEVEAPACETAAVEQLGSRERPTLDQIVLSSRRTPQSARALAIDGTSVPKQ